MQAAHKSLDCNGNDFHALVNMKLTMKARDSTLGIKIGAFALSRFRYEYSYNYPDATRKPHISYLIFTNSLRLGFMTDAHTAWNPEHPAQLRVETPTEVIGVG